MTVDILQRMFVVSTIHSTIQLSPRVYLGSTRMLRPSFQRHRSSKLGQRRGTVEEQLPRLREAEDCRFGIIEPRTAFDWWKHVIFFETLLIQENNWQNPWGTAAPQFAKPDEGGTGAIVARLGRERSGSGQMQCADEASPRMTMTETCVHHA